MTSPTEFRL